MVTITIPQELIKNDDLIIIPRKEYEKLFRVFKKKTYTQLDRDLDEAISEYKAGKFFGPFTTAEQGIKFLKSHRVAKKK
ncbi:MAG: hypothetical protein Q8O41_12245 [Candidatus Methanoperedens sp.]|nr:hypothetical protein [Candidatus Methanoperedens sp.]